MTSRSKKLAVFTLLIGALIFSVSLNFYQSSVIDRLMAVQTANDTFDYEAIKQEIQRLENVKYE